MSYDFSCNEETFHWSHGNWERLLEMIKRTGADLPLEELRAQERIIPPDTARDIWTAVAQIIERGIMPNMDIAPTSSIGAWLKKELGGEMGIPILENPWTFTMPWSGLPLSIPEDDPRWQGLFFRNIMEFMDFLARSVIDNKEIYVN